MIGERPVSKILGVFFGFKKKVTFVYKINSLIL